MATKKIEIDNPMLDDDLLVAKYHHGSLSDFFRGPLFDPPVDMFETDDTIEFNLEAPGIAKKDVAVEITKNRIVISGEKKISSIKHAIHHRMERVWGHFHREFELPCEIKKKSLKITHDNGILVILVSKQ